MSIDSVTLQALRDPESVAIRERHFQRLEAFFDRPGRRPEVASHILGGGQECPPSAAATEGGFSNPPRQQPFFLSGVGIMNTDSPRDFNWEEWLPGALDTLATERAPLAKHPRIFRPLLLGWNPHGVHFIDELFGARVFMLEGGWQAETLATPIGQLRAPDLDSRPTWREVRRFSQRLLDLELDAVTLMLPTISSPLNIAINLYGDRVITAMMMDPDATRHDLRVITDVLCAIHRWYVETVPFERMQPIAAGGRTCPRGMGQICGCSTQLLSPSLYDEFIAPLDEEVLSVWPRGGLIHLCGAHAHHIPTFSRMRSLRAVQMNHRAVDDLKLHYEGLRADQILYPHPYDQMPVDRVLEETNGGDRCVLCAPPPAVRHLL